MAFVTDMRGECRAGVTPHTVWYPTIPARPKVVTIWVNAALGEIMPRARQVETPAETERCESFLWWKSCALCLLVSDEEMEHFVEPNTSVYFTTGYASTVIHSFFSGNHPSPARYTIKMWSCQHSESSPINFLINLPFTWWTFKTFT